jgi:dihydrofolate synthase/folylpolyglutamate synthase
MVLARQIQKWRQDAPEKPVHLILGMLSTKEPEEFFVHLRGLVASATAISIPHQKQAFSAETLAQKLGIETAENAGAALLRVMQKDRRPCRILIAGSLYLAGEILRENG